MIRDIVILGGGTAGWMAAAALAHHLQGQGPRITVVESSRLGTVGVGEATLPGIRHFNNSLGLDEVEFIRATRATFKLGIAFPDWAEPGVTFFHPFCGYGLNFDEVDFQHWLVHLRNHGHDPGPLDRYALGTQLALAGRFAQPNPAPPIPAVDFNYAFHFDAARYAAFLRDHALAAGVRHLDDEVVAVRQDPDSGEIRSLGIREHGTVAGDFFIDCSGFRSLLLGETLGVGYEDWRHWLPCDRAVTAQGPAFAEPPSYTEARARDGGWTWKIPLRHRTGHGYVYCSDFVSEEAAAETLRSAIGAEPLTPLRSLRFVAGRRRVFWEKNCVALGLASGFLEPLESTSIALIQNGIGHLLTFFSAQGTAEVERREANRRFALEMERIRDFIILHYWAGRRADTPFWRHCRGITPPDSLLHKVEVFRRAGQLVQYEQESFEPPSWLSLLLGFGLWPQRSDLRTSRRAPAALAAEVGALAERLAAAARQAPTHGAFLARHFPLDDEAA